MDKNTLYGLLLPDQAAGAILISDEKNMRYLSGFRGGEGMLYISPERQVLITDSRYMEEAEAESLFEVIEERKGRKRADIIRELICRDHADSLAYEDRALRCFEFDGLREALPEVQRWIPLKSAADDVRMIKRPDEIVLIREAFRISQEAFLEVLEIIRPGMTEKEARAELEYRMMKKGASGLAFDTIVASGPNSSMPHAIPTGRPFENGDFITFDFGCRYDGYCSDMTRTVALGSASEEQRKVYQTVLQAQLAALAFVKAGVICADADRIAREVIGQAGYGQYFGHALGHSLGLFIHEKPALSPSDETVLSESMLVTVEPGIYLPGRFGVRIEDTVVITAEGCEDLVTLPKDLMIL